MATIHPQEAAPSLGALDTEWVAYLREQARDTLEEAEFLPGAPEGVPTDYEVRGASSASRGLDGLAEEYGADTIVIGSSRRAAEGGPARAAPDNACCRDRPARSPWSGASLHLFTVSAHRAERFAPLVGQGDEDGFLAAAAVVLQQALDRALASLPEGIQAAASLLTGDVADALGALDERDVDLLICGSRGYGPLSRVLLGGVSARLIRRAAAPVLVVPRSAA